MESTVIMGSTVIRLHMSLERDSGYEERINEIVKEEERNGNRHVMTILTNVHIIEDSVCGREQKETIYLTHLIFEKPKAEIF